MADWASLIGLAAGIADKAQQNSQRAAAQQIGVFAPQSIQRPQQGQPGGVINSAADIAKLSGSLRDLFAKAPNTVAQPVASTTTPQVTNYTDTGMPKTNFGLGLGGY